jgi:ADP-ribosylglycohydrolase
MGRGLEILLMDRQSRYRGALLGLAAGDALGTTVEFCPPDSFVPLTTIVGGGPFRMKPGEWTDDTTMALCMAESLIACKGFDPMHQMETYIRWYRDGHWSCKGHCFDIGTTTNSALHRFERTRQPYCGSTNAEASGNGSIMRLAPTPLFFARRPSDAVRRSADSSRTTHGSVHCVDACRYLGGLIVAALDGVEKEVLLANRFEPLIVEFEHEPLSEKIANVAAGSFKTKNPPAIRGTGYVVDSLEAALWAFHRSSCFRDGALLAVNLGDDADTTGAVYGQLAGAYYGEDGIPKDWRDVLAMRSEIEAMADRLYELSESQ